MFLDVAAVFAALSRSVNFASTDNFGFSFENEIYVILLLFRAKELKVVVSLLVSFSVCGVFELVGHNPMKRFYTSDILHKKQKRDLMNVNIVSHQFATVNPRFQHPCTFLIGD